MICALAPDRADQAFSIPILPGRAVRCGPVPDPHCAHTSLECNTECSVVVANEIFRCTVPRKRFGDLARQPLGRRIVGHREPQQPPPLVPENQKCEKLLERNGRNHKQINRRDPLHMIADEGLPGLQWPIWPRYHVDRNRRLRELDTELEQLAMDLGGAPDRVLKAHSSDQIPHLFGDPRPAPGRTRLPSPVSGKTPSMPPQDGLWSDDGYGVKDARATTIQPAEQNTIDPTQMRSPWRTLLQDIELMPQNQELGFQLLSRLEAVAQLADEQEADCNHAAIMF